MENDLLLMAKDGLIYVKNFIKNKKIDYRLNRKYSHRHIKKVEFSPKIKSSTNINLDEFEKTKFKEAITYFTQVLEKNFISLDLGYFYHNMKSLRIEDLKNMISEESILGKYLIFENKILLYDDCLQTIFHELFHVASSVYQDKRYYSGFYQNFSKHDLGYGLNEGYTELLTNRYFKNVEPSVKAFPNEVKIASLLEKIIGQGRMQSLYLRADLSGLLKEMQKYMTSDETANLISKIDKINSLDETLNKSDTKNFSLELYLDYLRDIYLILFKGYSKKIRIEYEHKWLGDVSLANRITYFLEKEEIMVTLGNNCYTVVNRDDFVNIFNETFKDLGIQMEWPRHSYK